MKFATEIPGPTMRNAVLDTMKEEYKYSTPIEGPDNQFGSADRPDDEDDHETTSDNIEKKLKQRNSIYDNSTKNKTLFSTTQNTKISNKVNKITYEILNKENTIYSGTSYNYSNFNLISFILICIIR